MVNKNAKQKKSKENMAKGKLFSSKDEVEWKMEMQRKREVAGAEDGVNNFFNLLFYSQAGKLNSCQHKCEPQLLYQKIGLLFI